jgi:hypothetical protein
VNTVMNDQVLLDFMKVGKFISSSATVIFSVRTLYTELIKRALVNTVMNSRVL